MCLMSKETEFEMLTWYFKKIECVLEHFDINLSAYSENMKCRKMGSYINKDSGSSTVNPIRRYGVN